VSAPRLVATEPRACRTCTIHLVRLARRRAWWFGPFRASLVGGMRLLAWWHGIPVERDAHRARPPACEACLRHTKNELKARSRAFSWGNERLNPLFNRLRDGLVSVEEIDEAREVARDAVSKGK